MSFRHKGLQNLFTTGAASGVLPEHAKRLRLILAALDEARLLKDIPESLQAHPLKGDRAGWYAVKVNKNWRLVFRFIDGKIFDVDYLDYH